MTTLRVMISCLLLAYLTTGSSQAAQFKLPVDPTWTKRPSGKHKQQHLYDLGAFKHGVIKGALRPYAQATVGMAISRNGEYAVSAIKYSPLPRCRWSSGRESCFIVAQKGKVKRKFAITNDSSTDIQIVDIQDFIDFIDGPDPFRISYADSKNQSVVIDF